MDDELDGKLDRRVRLEYRDRGKFEAQLQVANDILIFQMHTDVFEFDANHLIWQNPYVQSDRENSYCGLINIYNFLSDSFKFNRNADEGYLIGRIFINRERRYFVEGKQQTSMRAMNFGKAEIDREALIGILEPAIWFALQFDRTEQLARELDQRVADRTRARTEETEARKSMMLNIFHDLRSPLFAVSSGLDTLEAAPEALPALLPALQQRMRFLRRLTEDLFLAAKLEQKQGLLNEDRVSLSEAAQAVCENCRSEAENKGVALCAQFDAELPVWGDAVRLQQILQNLVTNAIHYTPSGGTITVHSWEAESSALVCVQDTGCGIAPEDQAAVFDRYFHTTANTKHDSTGLGLTIAQELARLHHGEILLESEVGKGSCFTLKLPLLAD